MLGHALLGLGRPEDARVAYGRALELVRGASVPVNEGQIIHQIGLCQDSVGDHHDAARHFARAAVCFQKIGMREYLANALGRLGHALLKLDGAGKLPKSLPSAVLEDGIRDALDSLVRCLSLKHVPKLADSGWGDFQVVWCDRRGESVGQCKRARSSGTGFEAMD